jgi:predicted ATPase
MKLASLSIQNFRGIANRDFPFTDELGRVNPVTLIVGPNTSGKSSILDAIWFGLQQAIGYGSLRRDFRSDPEFVVQTGKRFSRLHFNIEISEDERVRIHQWKNDLIELGDIRPFKDSDQLKGELVWTYPPQPGYNEQGYQYPNGFDWLLLQGKDYARRLRRLQAHSRKGLHLAGGVYLFEQERQIITGRKTLAGNNGSHEVEEDQTPDMLQILIDLGIRSKLGQLPAHDDWYQQIQAGYAAICSPGRMGDVFTRGADSEYNIEFIRTDGSSNYTFHGLSSGERAVLNFLVQYFAKRMFNSIVLIDELELNLHPIWQRTLMRFFEQRDDGNQFIITTHSPTLREYIPDRAIIELGALDDSSAVPAWQFAGEET